MENERLYKALAHARKASIMENTFQVSQNWAGDRFNGINLSSEMSFLIKEAGRLCDSFASDLFYDLKTLHNDLVGTKDKDSVLFDQNEYHWVVGIRDYGCDHDNFIISRLQDNENMAARYRAMYEIEVKPHERWEDDFTMTLYPIDVRMLQHYFKYEEA